MDAMSKSKFKRLEIQQGSSQATRGGKMMQLEYNSNVVRDNGNLGNGIAITPPIDEDYWMMRVPLSGNQAIVCFPKFFTVGIGFQNEEDWNTNLPYTCEAEEIFAHIAHNKGDKNISDADCIKAIQILQAEIKAGKLAN